MAEQRSTTRTGGSNAAAMIAELWAEREQERTASVPPRNVPPTPSRIPTAEVPRPPADPRQRALAMAIIILISGGVLGVVAMHTGFLGAPSKAEFVAEADVACAASNGGVNAISKPAGYPTLATAASTVVTTTDTQLGRLRSLDLPGDPDRGRARAVFTAIAATNSAGRTLQSAAGASDAAQTATASRSFSLSWQDALAKARTYGFTTCLTGMQAGVDALVAGANGVVKDAFVSNANRVCIDFLGKADQIKPPRNANDLNRFVNESRAIFDKLVIDLKAIPVAPGDEATVAEMIGSMEKMSSQLGKLLEIAAAQDRRALANLEKEADALEAEANAKFGAYGLTACGG